MMSETDTREKNEYELDAEDKGEQAGKLLSDAVNGSYRKVFTKSFILQLTGRTHRTLQQLVMGVFLELLRKWAEKFDEGNYDGRNENTCRLARKIIDSLDEKDHLPYI